MRYRHLLFDLDGTLFDYDRAESNALKKTFLDSGLQYADDLLDKYRRINTGIWRDHEDGLISQDDLKTERFRRLLDLVKTSGDPALLSASYLANLSGERALLPGALTLLEVLDSGGYLLYLITNGLTEVQRSRLAGSEITPFFRDIFISGEIGAAKPHKTIFSEAFRRMGAPPLTEVLIIGDSLSSDIAGGIASGIDTCWFNPSGSDAGNQWKPVYQIRKLTELTAILEGRGKGSE